MNNAKGLGLYIGSHGLLLVGLLAVFPESLLLALALFFGAMALSLNPFFIFVPPQTSVVLENSLNGTLREVSSGVVVKYPWESAPSSNWLNLRTMSTDIGGRFVSQNGPVVDLKGELRFQVLPGHGERVVKHTQGAFVTGIRQVCASFLSDFVSKRTARDVREQSSELEKQLRVHLSAGPDSLKPVFGVEPTLVSITEVKFDDAYQVIRTRTSAAQELLEIAGRLRTGAMNETDALEAAMLVSGDVQKRIVDVRGSGASALSSQLVAIAESIRGDRDKSK